MTTFHTFALPDVLKSALDKKNFINPTPIQAEAIPHALSKRDVLGSAQTGTGKTLAFALPILAQLLEDPKAMALVLAPTRELAHQVGKMVNDLLEGQHVRLALLIGGEPFVRQVRDLKAKARLIVGTPGRVLDHLEQRTFIADSVSMLVLDETDRMLDMGFGVQLDAILKFVPEERQTLMFSATFPPKIEKLAGNYLKNPERVAVGCVRTPIARIKKQTIEIAEDQKYSKLVHELSEREGSAIVFVRTRAKADVIARKLFHDDELQAQAIHGDLRQNKRTRVLNAFRVGRTRILVATDVAARGLDVPHVQHVINFDLPQVPEDYIHRIGRTGRAGAEGESLCMIAPHEKGLWADIQRFLDPEKAKKSFAPREGREDRPSRFQSRNNRRFDDRREGRGDRRPSRDRSFEKTRRSFGDDRFEKRSRDDRFSNRSRDDRFAEYSKDEAGGKPSFRGRRDDRNFEGRSFGRRDDNRFDRFGGGEGKRPFGPRRRDERTAEVDVHIKRLFDQRRENRFAPHGEADRDSRENRFEKRHERPRRNSDFIPRDKKFPFEEKFFKNDRNERPARRSRDENSERSSERRPSHFQRSSRDEGRKGGEFFKKRSHNGERRSFRQK